LNQSKGEKNMTTTIDQTKKDRLRHAAEVLTWAADGKPFEYVNPAGVVFQSVGDPEHWIRAVISFGGTYRLKPAKTRRPFTEKEARRLVGCVIVGHGDYGVYIATRDPGADWREGLAKDGARYHLPGDPDNLKPCWVEE
jgi:hypothetical protein